MHMPVATSAIGFEKAKIYRGFPPFKEVIKMRTGSPARIRKAEEKSPDENAEKHQSKKKKRSMVKQKID